MFRRLHEAQVFGATCSIFVYVKVLRYKLPVTSRRELSGTAVLKIIWKEPPILIGNSIVFLSESIFNATLHTFHILRVSCEGQDMIQSR